MDERTKCGDWYCRNCGYIAACDTCHIPVSWHSADSGDELSNLKAQVAEREGEIAELIESIPTTWLDPLLTGPESVLPDGYKYCPQDIENLLRALKKRLLAKHQKAT